MRLGLFMMPLHPPRKDYHQMLEEDMEAVIHADRLGFDDVWIGEHFSSMTEPITSPLMFMAKAIPLTERVRLCTGVLVLPLRNPLYNARQLATIDALAGGRVDLGIGVGWLKEEADALQMPWAERGARTDEHIQVMRTLWQSDAEYVGFKGRFYQFDEIDPRPHPQQRPIPIYIGGHSPAAKARAGRIGDGWITTLLDPVGAAYGTAMVVGSILFLIYASLY